MISYIPNYIRTTEDMAAKTIVTNEHWNEMFNLLTTQGNASAKGIADLIALLISQLGAAEIGASVESVAEKRTSNPNSIRSCLSCQSGRHRKRRCIRYSNTG